MRLTPLGRGSQAGWRTAGQPGIIFPMMTTPSAPGALQPFRDHLYPGFTQRRAALFALVDALLTAEAVPSPVHLSLAPAHRRGWGSLYAALAAGRLDVAALRALLARHPLAAAPPI